jgi:GAF domain-containing protein
LFGLGLAVLWQWSDAAPGVATPTHVCYVHDGPPPAAAPRQEDYPWYTEQMLAGRMVAFSSLDELPPEAAVDRERARQLGIKSGLCLPLSLGGEPPVGALALNTLRIERGWPGALVTRLQLVAQVFTNATVQVRYQTCNDRECLPPALVKLPVSIDIIVR